MFCAPFMQAYEYVVQYNYEKPEGGGGGGREIDGDGVRNSVVTVPGHPLWIGSISYHGKAQYMKCMKL